MASEVYKKISDQALKAGLKMLENSFGKDFAEKGLQDTNYKAIPTGHDDLDAVLTREAGGIYLGGICELFGNEGGGKTSVAMRMIGIAQTLGLNCAWFDAEHSFSPDLARLNRVDLDKLVYLKRITGEGDKAQILDAGQVLDRVFHAVWSNVFSVVVVDSVAALMPERIVAEDYDPSSQGISELARVMSAQLPKISSACAEKECTVIFINQVRMKPGEKYGAPWDTPGGRALKFYASQRISVNKIGGKSGLVTQATEDGISEVVGHYARVKVEKNRRHEPCYDPLEIPIYYREYFPDAAKKCYDLSRKLQVVTTRRGMLTWKDGQGEIVGQVEGESNMLQFIRGTEDKKPKGAYLAHCCVEAAKHEKNQKKKVPVKVPSGILKLAKGHLGSFTQSPITKLSDELGVDLPKEIYKDEDKEAV